MLKEEKKELTGIGRDVFFQEIIKKLSTDILLSAEEKSYILACSILFLRHYNNDRRYISFADFSYYIILKYSLAYNDYSPLYDFSANFGFYPVAKIILDERLIDNYKITDYLINLELARFRYKNEYTETLEQHTQTSKFLRDKSNEKSYLAPTSFGKSSLIVDYIKEIPSTNDLKIAIIVPTKSLLAQTHKMIRRANLRSKIIIHDEMYNDATSFIAIFTQERALRLLNRNSKASYNILFIDEAHNLLKKDGRSILLSRLIAKNKYRNPDQQVIYLSPLIEDSKNLKIKEEQSIAEYSINFNVKEPEIFEYKLENTVLKYNRFVDQFYELSKWPDPFTYLKTSSESKNFIYSHSPLGIEALTKKLCCSLPELEQTNNLSDLEGILKKEVHKDFYAIKYLKYGVIYLHGKLPDMIKEYLESKFRKLPELKYIVANSVILEGINLPIDCLYIFNTWSLQGRDLMNLIGRVNRLNNIFSQNGNNLDKLLPKVHFINSIEYGGKRVNMENKIRLLRSRVFEDIIENPILCSFDFEKIKMKLDKKNRDRIQNEILKLQNEENFLYSGSISDEDQLKRYLIETGISVFYNDINQLVRRLGAAMEAINNGTIEGWVDMRMMDKIEHLFIHNIDSINDFEFERLKYIETRNYYEHYILINQKKSLNENINSQFRYFKDKAVSSDKKLYVGKAYGEERRSSGVYPESKLRVYIDLSKKKDSELINLAIAKFKMEEDFVSFKLSKFIEMLFDYKLISKNSYNMYIYGTTNERKIEFTKFGMSISLISRLEKDGQLKNLSFDEFNNLEGNADFLNFKNNIDDFYRFEIDRYLN